MTLTTNRLELLQMIEAIEQKLLSERLTSVDRAALKIKHQALVARLVRVSTPFFGTNF